MRKVIGTLVFTKANCLEILIKCHIFLLKKYYPTAREAFFIDPKNNVVTRIYLSYP